jgi:hypothetical protein
MRRLIPIEIAVAMLSSLIFWHMGLNATAEAAVTAAPPKPEYIVPSNPYLPTWKFDLVFTSTRYAPICRLEPVW